MQAGNPNSPSYFMSAFQWQSPALPLQAPPGTAPVSPQTYVFPPSHFSHLSPAPPTDPQFAPPKSIHFLGDAEYEFKQMVEEVTIELDTTTQQLSKCIDTVLSKRPILDALNVSPLLLSRSNLQAFKVELYNWVKAFESQTPMIISTGEPDEGRPCEPQEEFVTLDLNSSNAQTWEMAPFQKELDYKHTEDRDIVGTTDPHQVFKVWSPNDIRKQLQNPPKKYTKAKQTPKPSITTKPSQQAPAKQLTSHPMVQGYGQVLGSQVSPFQVPQLPATMKKEFPQETPTSQQQRIEYYIADQPPEFPALLSDFELLDTIIIGSFSKTRLVKYRKTNKLYALKSMNRSTIYEYKQLHHIYNEKSILSSITHPGIPRLYTTFSHRTSVHCLMEFVPGGELFTHIRRSGKLEGTTCKFYVAELVVLLEFLHERHIVFRDIKPENLLLDLRGHIKLYDFTFAKQLNEGRTYTICGTPDYMAPEILNGQPYSLEVDWWSLGVLMFEMMTGYPPFDTRNEISPPSRDPAGIVFPKYINPLALDLMKRLLVVEPEKRIGAKDVMELKSHPWFFQEPAIHWMEITKWSGEGPINLAPLTSFYDHYPEDENTDFEDEEQNVDLPKEVSDFFDSF